MNVYMQRLSWSKRGIALEMFMHGYTAVAYVSMPNAFVQEKASLGSVVTEVTFFLVLSTSLAMGRLCS